MRRAFLKLAVVWLSVKVEGKNAGGIGIRLMCDKEQGVGVVWRGKNGEERGDVEQLR